MDLTPRPPRWMNKLNAALGACGISDLYLMALLTNYLNDTENCQFNSQNYMAHFSLQWILPFRLNKTCHSVQEGSNRKWDLNHTTIVKYIISQHLTYLRKSHRKEKWFYNFIFISRIKRSMNRILMQIDTNIVNTVLMSMPETKSWWRDQTRTKSAIKLRNFL